MRRISFRTVLEDVLGIAGYPYDSATQSQLDQAARFINRHVRYGWEWGPWPEWTRAEQRAFASDYYDSVTYGIGDLVYYATTDKYYSCIVISQGNVPTNATYWIETTTYDKHIAFEQAYERAIGRVWTCTKYNPYLKFRGSNYTYPHMLSSLGIFVPDAGETRLWVLFSDRPPEFSAKIHSTTAAYSKGDIVYYPGTETSTLFPNRGECFRADIDSAGLQVWVLVEFPVILHAFVVNRAAADMLRHYGQRELAQTYDAMAANELVQEWDKVNTEGYQRVIGGSIEMGI
jgi:hypothetical protein